MIRYEHRAKHEVPPRYREALGASGIVCITPYNKPRVVASDEAKHRDLVKSLLEELNALATLLDVVCEGRHPLLFRQAWAPDYVQVGDNRYPVHAYRVAEIAKILEGGSH